MPYPSPPTKTNCSRVMWRTRVHLNNILKHLPVCTWTGSRIATAKKHTIHSLPGRRGVSRLSQKPFIAQVPSELDWVVSNPIRSVLVVGAFGFGCDMSCFKIIKANRNDKFDDQWFVIAAAVCIFLGGSNMSSLAQCHCNAFCSSCVWLLTTSLGKCLFSVSGDPFQS